VYRSRFRWIGINLKSSGPDKCTLLLVSFGCLGTWKPWSYFYYLKLNFRYYIYTFYILKLETYESSETIHVGIKNFGHPILIQQRFGSLDP
jgi:hypothetical protein